MYLCKLVQQERILCMFLVSLGGYVIWQKEMYANAAQNFMSGIINVSC